MPDAVAIPARLRPPWIWLRVAAGGLACLATALVLDAWLRFSVLPLHGRNEAKRIRAASRAARVWARVMFSMARWAAGLRVSVEGQLPGSGRFLIVANHQSSLDIPLLITTFRSLNLKFVAMERLRRGKPVISLVLRHGGSVFVGKTDIGEDLAAMARFGADLERLDGSPVIFPAGGLERDQGARRFYLAGIEILRRASRLPILPVAIEGMSQAPSVGRILRIAGARVTLRVFEPVACEVAERDPRGTYLRLEEQIYRRAAEIRGDAGGPVLSPSTADTSAGRRAE
jgi:1-acyl-sn-glycerol-3-phosphate acyltransferase